MEETNRYELRKRKRNKTHENVGLSSKRSRNEIVRREVTPKLIKVDRNLIEIGLVILAKMRTYAAWPSAVVSLKKNYISVKFFGDDTIGNVPYDAVGIFSENHELIRSNLRKKINGYIKAVKFAEGTLNITPHLSIVETI